MKLSNNFSVVYHGLLQDLVETIVPTETWADCSNCHHCASPKNVRSNTKCCDFTPSLPNYVVGSILADKTADYQEGNSRILNILEKKLGVTPFGILPSANYQKKFTKSRLENYKSSQQEVDNLKCPYYLNGDCTIYKYRTDQCGFYHCSSVALSFGKNYWKKAREFNVFLDKTLSIHIAEEFGFNYSNYPNKLKGFSSQIELHDGTINHNAYKEMWGNWYGKEVEYFLECEKLFHSLEIKKVKSILGVQFEEMKIDLLHSSKELSLNKVPDYLIYNHQAWERMQNRESFINPIQHLILKHFDGKTETATIVKKGKIFKANMTALLKISLNENILQVVIKE